MTKKWRHALVLVVLGIALAGADLLAISARTVNLGEMVRFSDRVFYGRCVAVKDMPETVGGMAVRVYRFQVLEGLKGVPSGSSVDIRQIRSGRGAMSIPGLPGYRKGDEVMLFLYPDSRFGLTSPVGLEQGFFRAEKREDGEVLLRNGMGNSNLTEGLGDRALAEFGLTSADLVELEPDQPVTLSTLRRAVSRISSHLTAQEGRAQ